MNPDTSTGPVPAPVLIFGGFVTISSGSIPAPSLISGVLLRSTLFTTRRVLDETGNEEVVVSCTKSECADVTFNYLFITLPLSRNAVKPNSSDTATQLLVLISVSM
ncbi:hypothetical protein IGI04_033920 [Brassica rapa subsp. trilocularis]|uniref:Uncharacterized protein n=1 Tax=Brassica rapa subsp. trilocularis TaxID=1813537 RepID=A0ABQ7LA01_BRACM|nr:hypothetical protein IGI04_033920 [Brassica rapa subsp. trilocularis]